MRDTILEELRNGVLLLTLNRPKQKNAFNHRMWCDLRDALADALENDDVRAVVITGSPGAFSRGFWTGIAASGFSGIIRASATNSLTVAVFIFRSYFLIRSPRASIQL